MKRLIAMSSTIVNIRIDSKLKKQFEEVCTKTVTEHRIPFEIRSEIPNSVTRKAIEDARNGIGMSKAFSSIDELMDDLNAEDQMSAIF